MDFIAGIKPVHAIEIHLDNLILAALEIRNGQMNSNGINRIRFG